MLIGCSTAGFPARARSSEDEGVTPRSSLLIEAAYAPVADEGEWLERLAEAAEVILNDDLGVFVFGYRIDDEGQVRCGPPTVTGAPSALRPVVEGLVLEAVSIMPEGALDRLFSKPQRPVASSSELLCPGKPIGTLSDEVAARVAKAGARDCVALNVRDASASGIVVAGLRRSVTSLRRRERAELQRVARHVEGAMRLRVLSSSSAHRHGGKEADAAVVDVVRSATLLGRVARHLAQGSSQKRMAYDLGIAEGSVYRYIEALKLTAGVATTVALVAILKDATREGTAEAASSCSPDRPALRDLPAAERAVVEAALRGLRSAQIAALRGCSRRTVDNQLRAAYRRLKIGSRKELASFFERSS